MTGRVVGTSSSAISQLSRQHYAGKVINIFIAAVLLLIALLNLLLVTSPAALRNKIFSLEPREIGLLVRQQAMMESIYEGVIVIDHHRRIEVINHAARSLSD